MTVKTKLSKLTKIVLPLLAFPIMASSVYCDEKNLYPSQIEENQYQSELNVEEENSDKEFPRFYFNFSTPNMRTSLHPKKDENTKENNNPFGVGMEINEELDIFYRHYTNTHGNPSDWAGFNNKNFCGGDLFKACVGWSGGIVTGYDNIGGEFGGLLPVVSIYGEIMISDAFGFQAYYIPGILVAGTFKLKY
jgi:hypothetical protein